MWFLVKEQLFSIFNDSYKNLKELLIQTTANHVTFDVHCECDVIFQ